MSDARDHHGTHALVIGAGVSGLTTALALLERGHGVTLVSHETGRPTTSWVAGALWEWPPAICRDGRAPDDPSVRRDQQWALASLRRFESLHADGVPGVNMRPVTFYFDEPLREGTHEHDKMLAASRHTRDFEHGPHLLRDVPAGSGLCDAYRHRTAQVDMDTYLPWLLERVTSLGGRYVVTRVDRLDETLLDRFDADIIVNATGLASSDLADDPVTPVLGVLLQVRNDGTDFAPIRSAHCTAPTTDGSDTRFVFVLPNGTDRLVLGGIGRPHGARDEITPDHDVVREIRERCVAFLPQLAKAIPIDGEPIRAGLRPVRPGGARVEREPDRRIIHNYGHGGAGVLLSWGAATDVVSLLEHGAIPTTVSGRRAPISPTR